MKKLVYHTDGRENLKEGCTEFINPFSTNVPVMNKPGSWFLLAKCLKNTCGRVTF